MNLSISPMEAEALVLSLKVAAWATMASVPFAIACAWVLSRTRWPGMSIFNALIHLPLVLPPVVVGYGLLVVLGRNGAIGSVLHDLFGITLAFTWKGAAVAAAVIAFPLMVRAMRLSLDAVDRGLEDTARTLGAGPLKTFATITLPLMMPGIVTGVVLAFARALGEFGATITFVSNIPGETQTLPLALYTLTETPGGEAAALRLAVISVVLALGALMASEVLARRAQSRMEDRRR